MKRSLAILILILTLGGLLFSSGIHHSLAQNGTLTFAILGDYGTGGDAETSVANLIKSWNPAFIVTNGDGYRPEALGTGDEKYDNSTGKDYCPYLAGITTSGTHCPQPGPSNINKFFPALGNHDYYDAGTTNYLPSRYTNYFDIPGIGAVSSNTSGNERYYDFIQGPIHFFILNSNSNDYEEPDGTTSDSIQGNWLKTQMAASKSLWKIVVLHHPPYTSGLHGPSLNMRWPFKEWGADAVVAGHDHDYERILKDGIVYFVNGNGGAPLYPCGTPIEGSQYCIKAFGAQRVTMTNTLTSTIGISTMQFDFITTDGIVHDTQRLEKTWVPVPTATPTPTPTVTPDAPRRYYYFITTLMK